MFYNGLYCYQKIIESNIYKRSSYSTLNLYQHSPKTTLPNLLLILEYILYSI